MNKKKYNHDYYLKYKVWHIQRTKIWKEDNPDKLSLSNKVWKKNNPKKVKLKNQKYYKKHREQIGLYQKSWRGNNIEKRKLYSKIWRDNNPQSSTTYSIELQLVMNNVRKRDNNTCQWQNCGLTHREAPIHVHHIFPRSEYPELELIEQYMICYCANHHGLWHRYRGDNYHHFISQIPNCDYL